MRCPAWRGRAPHVAYSIVFSAAGALIRGFAHESPMSPFANSGELWPGLLDGIPGC